MNIGFILSCYNDYGGVATWVKSLLPALSKNHTVRLGVLNQKSSKPVMDSSIELFSGIGGCRKVAWRSDALVIWHLGKDIGSVLNGTPRPPAIAVSHQGKDSAETLNAMFYQEAYAKKYVYVSPHAICSIPKHLHSKSVCISNSPDPSQLYRTDVNIRKDLNISTDDILISAMSRIHKEKGLNVVAQAVASLGSKFKFVISGRCCDKGYRRVLNQSGAILLPPSNTKDLLFASDLTVSASKSEGNSYALLESLLAKVPVISTKVGLLETYPELARIVDGTVDDIAQAISDDIQNIEGRKSRAEGSRQWIEENLDFNSFVKQWEDALYDILRTN